MSGLFSLSFTVDKWDVKVYNLAIKCCRQFEAITPSLYTHFPPKVVWLRPQSSFFLAGCCHLMRTVNVLGFPSHSDRILARFQLGKCSLLLKTYF